MEPLYTIGFRSTRGFTNGVFCLVEERLLDPFTVLEELLCWMSEDDVADFVQRSELFRDEDNQCIIRTAEDVLEEMEEEEEVF